MTTRDANGGVIPCYIGKSETVGKTSGVLSANLKRLATDTSKFGRWRDNYAYHIGDLSSIVLSGHDSAVQTEKVSILGNSPLPECQHRSTTLTPTGFLLGPSLEERRRVWADPSEFPRIPPDRHRKFDFSS
jgi:hypothetical protein